jgi:outer membrane protein assembly factor BamB
MKFLHPFFAALFCTLLLSGCGTFSGKDEDAAPLEGERISLFDLDQSKESIVEPASSEAQIPKIWRNEFWPQAGGYANHAMSHVALSADPLRKKWSSDIGAGSSKNLPLYSQPIIADGRVFTVDTDSEIRAFDAARGKSLWSFDAKPEGEDDPVIGGGVAFSGGRLFASTGFNEVVALNPSNGTLLWRKKVEGAVRSAPTAMPDRVYVVTVDNKTIALDAAKGDEIWSHQGLSETAGLLGTASPAANRDIVLPAYSSGEVYALQAETGTTLWSDSVAPMARAGTGISFADIRGLPVIDRGLVVAISYAGRIAAIDEHTGERRWNAAIAGTQTPFVSGNRVYVVSASGIVYALDLTNGKTVWKTQLPRYNDPESLKGQITWFGPVLAGGRLLLFSSNGMARDLDPQTGKITREWETDEDVISPPSIANETLYLLSADGTLSAWK